MVHVFILDAGWGIFPVLGFGLATMGVDLLRVFRRQVERTELLPGLAALTLLAGVLGTAMGVKRSAAALGALPPDERWIFFFGLDESLNCTVAALCCVMFATLLSTMSALRRPGPPAKLTDEPRRATLEQC